MTDETQEVPTVEDAEPETGLDVERLDILNRAIFEAKERIEDCASLSEDRLAELRKANLGDEDAMVMALAEEFISDAYCWIDG